MYILTTLIYKNTILLKKKIKQKNKILKLQTNL